MSLTDERKERAKSLAENFKQIMDLIEVQEKQLGNHLKELVEKSKHNEHLVGVKDEHDKHDEQKRQELITSFETLAAHLDKLSKDDSLNKDDAKIEMKRTLAELKKIRADQFSS